LQYTFVFTSLNTNRWKLAWLWATNVSSHNFRQKRCYTMMTFWRTTESFYMACWIPISIIYNLLYKKLYFFFVWRAVLSLSEILQKLYIWNYILQGVTTLWYNIHLLSYAISYQISYITVYGISHHQNDIVVVFVQIPTFVLFFVFLLFFFRFWPIFI
jgi:hypothetical protein